eukprot:INCI15946.1.p1 GENE.INCI15946.1~~INCI15946.1.p1  ORF type:complete len:407 (+),score=51.02 INCI15946.1:191-1411(+)
MCGPVAAVLGVVVLFSSRNVLANAVREEPFNAVNITVYHINPLSAAVQGGSPINMDTADAAGDFMFDMLEEYPFPIECPNGEASPSELCRNLEVAAADLVVTKLTLAAAQPFGSYAACNLCINHTDHFHHTCQDGTYFCFPKSNNYTVGYSNLTRWQSPERWAKCTNKTSVLGCQIEKIPWKFTPEFSGSWYSTQVEGMCANNISVPILDSCPAAFNTILELNASDTYIKRVNATSPEECCDLCGSNNSSGLQNCTAWSYRVAYLAENEPSCAMTSLPPLRVLPGVPHQDYSSVSDCGWRTLSIDKVVNATCQRNYFLSGVENASTPTDKECFARCGGVPGVRRNQSDPCWTSCFYAAVMGPEAGIFNGSVTGIPISTIVEIWERPMHPDFDACPDLRQGQDRSLM